MRDICDILRTLAIKFVIMVPIRRAPRITRFAYKLPFWSNSSRIFFPWCNNIRLTIFYNYQLHGQNVFRPKYFVAEKYFLAEKMVFGWKMFFADTIDLHKNIYMSPSWFNEVRRNPQSPIAKLNKQELIPSETGYVISAANSNPIGKYPVRKNPRSPISVKSNGILDWLNNPANIAILIIVDA